MAKKIIIKSSLMGKNCRFMYSFAALIIYQKFTTNESKNLAIVTAHERQ
jgi:hypothetical protein